MGVRNQIIFRRIIFLLFLAGGYCLIQNAYASRIHKKLSKSKVADFIEETSALTSGEGLNEKPGKIREYFEKHLNDKARFKTILRLNVPGFDPQETGMQIDKRGFIEGVEEGGTSLDGYKTEVKINNIDISRDGRKAIVQTSALETGTMPVENDEGDIEIIPVEGNSECRQILVLSTEGYIQMFDAKCETDIHFIQQE